ncbi:MAG: complex I subunit 5 family protein, partial [Clostridiales bacterium]|nr:complex I subunit 5 family protein [Clostridiales bacterium]
MQGNFVLPFLVFWPMFGALFCYLIGRRNKRWRDYCANIVTIVELAVAISLFTLVQAQGSLYFTLAPFGHDRLFFQMDGFRFIYGVITSLMWMCTTMFSREYFAHYRNRNRYYFFMLITLGATMGVFLSGDLLTTFTFFEVMSFTSYVMVIHDEKPGAQRAAQTYMAVAVIGGLVMLMGLFLLYQTVGTLEINLLKEACQAVENKVPLYWSAALMLVGFGGKAGMFPLHVWLPKAHPVAPAPASALLSGVLTKTGVYGILIICANIFFGDKLWGSVLLGIGVVTMFLGAFLALFSVDLKRTLACSSMSQIGFILVASSMQCILLAKESTIHYHFMAVHGALLHMMNHSLIKLVLFMAAGVVYMNLHKLNLNDIRGFGYRKPLLKFIFGMGVLAIIGMPFWSGYISKTLIHESIVEQIWYILDYTPEARVFQVVESIFTLTGGLTTAYMVKIYIAVFFEKNPYHQKEMDASNGRYMNKTSAFVLTGCSLLLPILGMTPTKTMNLIAEFGQGFMHGHSPEHAVEYFAWQNLRGGLASLTIG